MKKSRNDRKKTVDLCEDSTRTLTIELPSQIFERVERYAKENGLDFAGISSRSISA
jgi:hypothetical protein